ncbi:hypothetical protein [Gordonia soli]|uniref:Uncharacterized protein n=1 Tax=Gordonia soli NBRC 108243 TaxID=1223545 RepID=M0QQH1_9ACTN|nr:hypothetical protein GS4_26_01450 [Gordonia soli NBRC 108243]
MAIGLVALVVLNATTGSGRLSAAVAFAGVAACLGFAAFGRLGRRGAVVLTVDSDTVYLGNERNGIVSRPLALLESVSLRGPAKETDPMRGAADHDLRITGQRFLVLGFRPQVDDHGVEAVPAETWRVGVVHSDPAAAEVVDRLRSVAPEAKPDPTRPDPRQGDPTQTRPTQTGPSAESIRTDEERPVPPSGPRIVDAGSDEAAERLWEEATRRHDEILRDYGAYELAPDLLLRFPAVTDVTLEPVQEFQLALDEATALRTDRYPGSRARADAYQQAVAVLRRRWIACETNGKQIKTSYFQASDQADLDRALKLYNHAQSSTAPAEQATYYGRVRDIVTTMTDRGVLHPPEPAVAELHAVTRRAIESRQEP